MTGLAKRLITLAAICLALPALAQAQAPDRTAPDVITIGSAVTEIVFALEQGDRVLARDTTSGYPAAAMALPDVGYMRALSPEGVLSLGPALIIASQGSGPPEVIEVLKASGVRYVEIPEGFDGAAVARKIQLIGQALGTPDTADALAKTVLQDLEQAAPAAPAAPKRVMFLLSSKGGKLIAAGQDTTADAVIRLAGGANAVQGFTGYKPLTDEAATAAAPDVIVMMDRGGDHGASVDTLFALPALATTPAAKAGALLRFDGALLLGFGPRLPEAVARLHAGLYGG